MFVVNPSRTISQQRGSTSQTTSWQLKLSQPARSYSTMKQSDVDGVQSGTHWPAASQLAPGAQMPQIPPQPSSPHSLPLQSGTQSGSHTHSPVAGSSLHDVPGGQSPPHSGNNDCSQGTKHGPQSASQLRQSSVAGSHTPSPQTAGWQAGSLSQSGSSQSTSPSASSLSPLSQSSGQPLSGPKVGTCMVNPPGCSGSTGSTTK